MEKKKVIDGIGSFFLKLALYPPSSARVTNLLSSIMTVDVSRGPKLGLVCRWPGFWGRGGGGNDGFVCMGEGEMIKV